MSTISLSPERDRKMCLRTCFVVVVSKALQDVSEDLRRGGGASIAKRPLYRSPNSAATRSFRPVITPPLHDLRQTQTDMIRDFALALMNNKSDRPSATPARTGGDAGLFRIPRVPTHGVERLAVPAGPNAAQLDAMINAAILKLAAQGKRISMAPKRLYVDREKCRRYADF